MIALDGDTKNSTFSLNYRKAFPGRHIECFVAEQNMVGVAMGCAARERAITFSSTFAAFFTRTFDHLRMAAVSQTPANFCGSHCGVSIGELEICYFFPLSLLFLLPNIPTSSRVNSQTITTGHIGANSKR